MLLLVLLTAPLVATEPEIRLDDDPGSVTFGTVEAVGVPAVLLARLRSEEPSSEAWRAVFPVYTGEAPEDGQPPVWGTWQIQGEGLRFRPRFPLMAGQAYTARLVDGTTRLAEATFALPAPEADPTTVVEAIHPSGDELPANLLKLYIHFSASMSRGEAVRYLKIFDEDGHELPSPFVAPEHELWNPDNDRLTVFFDPGRIKRGVGPNETLGPLLEEGKSYWVVIGEEWQDGRGQPLVREYHKKFRAGAEDRTAPRIADWRLDAPVDSRKGVLHLHFPEPLDHALLERVLVVADGAGRLVDGEVEIGEQERRWSFRPTEPWAPGEYEILIGTELEDLAGNSLRRLFEEQMRGAVAPGENVGVERLPFTVPSTHPTEE